MSSVFFWAGAVAFVVSTLWAISTSGHAFLIVCFVVGWASAFVAGVMSTAAVAWKSASFREFREAFENAAKQPPLPQMKPSVDDAISPPGQVH